jgi:tetratricopeptide (TPR) repeat protein
LDLKEMTPLATQLFGDYVARHAAKKQRHVRLTLSLLAPRIAQLRPEVPEHGLWSYAYLELDQCEETPEFIDALALAPAPGGDEWAAWAAWIEAKERLSRTERAPDDFVEASALLLEGAYAQTSNDRAAAALAHHAGKFYARLDRYQDARRCFDLALSRDASYPEVLLAKARVARKTRAFEQGAELVEILLNERYINGVSVGLAAYAELVSYPGLLKEWVIDQIDDFIGFVDSVRVDGFAQPEQTIRAVCRGLEYSAPEIVVRLSRSVELPTVDELQNDRDRAGWAEQYLIYASSLQKIGEDYTTQAEVACAIFEACSKLDTFGLSRYAKCLLLAAKPEKAVTVLQQATDPFCRFYLSQSLYAVGEVAKAEQVIDKLVDESQSKPDRYTWDFYRWRGRIKERAGKQGEALSSFRSALNKCPGDATHDIDDIKRSISAIDPSGAGSTSSEG